MLLIADFNFTPTDPDEEEEEEGCFALFGRRISGLAPSPPAAAVELAAALDVVESEVWVKKERTRSDSL